MYFSFISAALLAILVSGPVEASNVFLAQLGSYQTEKESEQAWNEIKSTMKQEFAGLSYQLSALSLPPAGKKIYRLQSGPFSLRNQANDFCEKLRSNGQDCFVVESAVFAPKDAPAPAIQTAKNEEKSALPEPAVISPVEIAATPTEQAEKQIENIENKMAAVKSAPVPSTSSLPDTRKDMMVVASAIAAPQPIVPVVPSKPVLPSLGALDTPSFSLSDAPKKESVRDEFAASLSAPAAPAIAQKVAAPQIKPSMPKPAAEITKKPADLTPVKEKTPLLQEVAAPAPMAAAPEAKTNSQLPWLVNNKDVVVARADVFDASSVDIETPLPTVLPPKVTSAAPATAEPSKDGIPEINKEAAFPEKIQEVTKSVNSSDSIPFAIVDRNTGNVVAAPNAKRAALLPPPDATSVARVPEAPMHQSANASSVAGGFVEGRAPKSLNSQLPAVERRMTSSDLISPTDRRVEIDEAIQVPLSNEPKQQASLPKAESQPDTASTEEPKLSGKRAMAWGTTPSRSLLQHSYWVQLSYFGSDQAALNYWQGVKGKLSKTANGMRVRITRPLSAKKSTKSVSLQVGPFIEEADVTTLCGIVSAEGITCQMAKDIGVSTVAGTKRVRNAPRDYLNRRDVLMVRPSAAGPQYWLQLGSYRSQYDAEIAWLELRDTQPALQPYQPSIAEPSLSSSAAQIYRLRTGPFQIRTEAENICGQLENVEIGCVIVSE